MRFTLVTDGPTDQALIWILYWLCSQLFREKIKGEWFDPRRCPQCGNSLLDRITTGIQWYPCDLLFVHRDAEAAGPAVRYDEISDAITQLEKNGVKTPHVCVVPVRMTEAWLLFDERAIRRSAGNPNGKAALGLPAIERLETTPNPKGILIEAIKAASELPARRLKRLNMAQCRLRIAELISDYNPLRQLEAFRHLEQDLRKFACCRQTVKY